MVKMTDYWYTSPCNILEATDVSEVLTSSIIRAIIDQVTEAVRTSEMSLYVCEFA
jgi:hypothetical protein